MTRITRAARSDRRLLLGIAALFAALAVGCCTFLPLQKDADRPFRTGTIERYDDGTIAKGRLIGSTELGGLPCTAWTRFHPDGSLAGSRLANDATIGQRPLPAGTQFWLDEAGRLASCWLSRDTVFDGVPCKGGGKIDTSFHPTGGLASVFLAQDVELQGVPLEATVFHPVRFHPGGELAGGKLSRDWSRDGVEFPRGSELVFDVDGTPRVAP